MVLKSCFAYCTRIEMLSKYSYLVSTGNAVRMASRSEYFRIIFWHWVARQYFDTGFLDRLDIQSCISQDFKTGQTCWISSLNFATGFSDFGQDFQDRDCWTRLSRQEFEAGF